MAEGEFIGREALLGRKRMGVKRKLVGLNGRAGHRQAALPDRQGLGAHRRVTSGAPSPWLNKNIGLGYVAVEHAAVGTEIAVLVRRQPVAARIVQTPFYKRAR